MTNLTRGRAIWEGFIGAPGYSTFYCAGAEDPTVASSFLTSIHDLFDTLSSYLAPGVTVSFPGDMAVVDDATGQQVGAVSATAPADVTSSGVGAYSAVSGWGVDWLTGTFSNGRTVRGRTFFVPAASAGTYGTDGQVAPSARTAILAAVTTYMSANDGALRVIMRPTAKRPVGSSAQITSASVPSKVFMLASRRD